MSTVETGRRGEDIAAEFLRSKGYVILERNYYKNHGELDLIAREGEVLVFIEVKTRRGAGFAAAAAAVSPAKQKKLRETALFWLQVNGLSDKPARFDIIEVYTGGEKPAVRLIKNAF